MAAISSQHTHLAAEWSVIESPQRFRRLWHLSPRNTYPDWYSRVRTWNCK